MSTNHQPSSILCSWCNSIATHNLDTTYDQCCTDHFVQWFTF